MELSGVKAPVDTEKATFFERVLCAVKLAIDHA
jgi:hypothetical protein